MDFNSYLPPQNKPSDGSQQIDCGLSDLPSAAPETLNRSHIVGWISTPVALVLCRYAHCNRSPWGNFNAYTLPNRVGVAHNRPISTDPAMREGFQFPTCVDFSYLSAITLRP